MRISQPQVGHADGRGAELQDVTNAVVHLYKELFGRGPTRARSDFSGPDALLVTVENSLTLAEQNMVALAEDRRVREIRMFFQYAAEHQFRDAVEKITGRKVRAFVSGVDVGTDVSSEVFYFEPLPGT